MPIAVRFQLDPREVFEGFDRMKHRSKALGSAFRTIKPDMRDDQKDHASKKAGPEGAWPPRSSGTSARLARGKRRHLGKRRRKRSPRVLGKLSTAITFTASNAGVFATSRVPWSNVQQEGGTVGNRAKIPARPFLWLSDKLIARAATVFETTLIDALEGGA